MNKEDTDKVFEDARERSKEHSEEDNDTAEKLSKLFGNRLMELGQIIEMISKNEGVTDIKVKNHLIEACIYTLCMKHSDNTDEALGVLNRVRDAIIESDKVINK